MLQSSDPAGPMRIRTIRHGGTQLQISNDTTPRWLRWSTRTKPLATQTRPLRRTGLRIVRAQQATFEKIDPAGGVVTVSEGMVYDDIGFVIVPSGSTARRFQSDKKDVDRFSYFVPNVIIAVKTAPQLGELAVYPLREDDQRVRIAITQYASNGNYEIVDTYGRLDVKNVS